ncbi:MAG: GAF domain-containing protein [Chloroflexi bacterium]|nr:GAF domain-containing protein [Chloroflexota bacterium]
MLEAERQVPDWWAEATSAVARMRAVALVSEAVARVATAVAREVNLERMVAAVLDQAVMTLGARAAHVYLVAEERRELHLVGQRNLPSDLVLRLARVPFDAPFLAGRAASTRQIQVVEDVATLDPVLTVARDILSRTGSGSILSVPLVAFGRLVGVLTYTLPQPHHFTPEELAALHTIAEIFAVGFANAQAYEAERRLRVQVEAVSHAALAISEEFDLRAVLQTIVEQARVVAGAQYAALGIMSADPEQPFDPWVFSGLTPEQAAAAGTGRHPRPVGTLGVVARAGQAVRVADIRQHPAFAGLPPQHPALTSFLGVPIRYQGRSVGNLYLANKVGGEEFTAADQQAVALLAQHAALALEHARVHQQMAAEIAERRRAEAQLHATAAELERSNAELQQFAYVASHDLQEPLRMVASFTQLLARRYRGKLGPDADEFIAYAVDGATRMQRLIEDLLTYSRVGTRGRPFAPTDAAAVVDQVITDLEAAIRESGATVTRDALPTVLADPVQLGQLFQNLISNAIKFHRDAPPRVHLSAERRDQQWVFSVQDNGVGIAPEHLDRIFVIFQRLHTRQEFPGTGIGLAICKKIVERHGGRIWAESQPGQGTTFFFTLPADLSPLG